MPEISVTNETAETVDLLIEGIPKTELVNLDGERLYGKAAVGAVRRYLTRTCLALDADAATREQRATEVLDETDKAKLQEVTADAEAGEAVGR